MGRKSEKELESVVKSGLFVAVSIMTTMAIGLFAKASGIMALFTIDKNVIKLGAVLLRIVAVSEPLYAALIIYEGVFFGIGDTKMPFLFSVLTMWGIRICMTWGYVSMIGNNLKIVWAFMVMDNVCRCILLWWWYRKRKQNTFIE